MQAGSETSAASRQSIPYLKLNLLLIFILKYEIQDSKPIYEKYFIRDLSFCEDCFQHEIEICNDFFKNYHIKQNFRRQPIQILINFLPLNDKRSLAYLQLTNATYSTAAKPNETVNIIAKYLNENKLNAIKLSSAYHMNLSYGEQKDKEMLLELFKDAERLDGFQFCPNGDIHRLIQHFQYHSNHNELTICLHMLFNVELLLMPYLRQLQFPVPSTYAICGFSQYQQEIQGKPLIHLQDADYHIKLSIAKQLLNAAIKFTKGFNHFRIYITDMNLDNIVYNIEEDLLYFIDLDSVLVMDAQITHSQSLKPMHEHLYIFCENCFAYSPHDICSHQESDINLFAACQLLREDLNSNRNNGFLQPIPEEILKLYPNITRLLDECVDRVNGKSRRDAVLKLIALFEIILSEFY